MPAIPSSGSFTPELEASGRAYVELRHTGDHVEFQVSDRANTLVVRHCIPDAAVGGGIDSTLSLYVNGRFAQKLPLSSKFNWLYGPAGRNGQSNDPTAGSAHVFWAETAFILSSPVNAGDLVRLQRDADDLAAYQRLDLIDLEQAPAALPAPPPETHLSVAEFGASGDDQQDDTAAIQRCIEAAAAQGKGVWIPAGTYHQSERWSIRGVQVSGAGMWHTRIIGTRHGSTWGGHLGFILLGDGPAVRHLSITSAVTTSRATGGGHAFTGNASHWRVEDVWISHTNTGFWMSGATQGVVSRCRVRATYADGINLNNGASDNLVEHCHLRGTGDDSLAILSESHVPALSQRNTLRRNTASAPWWGHNCDIAGGTGHVIEDNLFADSGMFGGLVINLPSRYPMHALTATTLRRNLLRRCGGNFAGQGRGAIWVYAESNEVRDVVFSANEIHDAVFSGIHLHSSWKLHPPEVVVLFEGNLLANPGAGPPVLIESNLRGSARFTNNKVTGYTAGQGMTNRALRMTVTQAGNTWTSGAAPDRPAFK